MKTIIVSIVFMVAINVTMTAWGVQRDEPLMVLASLPFAIYGVAMGFIVWRMR